MGVLELLFKVFKAGKFQRIAIVSGTFPSKAHEKAGTALFRAIPANSQYSFLTCRSVASAAFLVLCWNGLQDISTAMDPAIARNQFQIDVARSFVNVILRAAYNAGRSIRSSEDNSDRYFVPLMGNTSLTFSCSFLWIYYTKILDENQRMRGCSNSFLINTRQNTRKWCDLRSFNQKMKRNAGKQTETTRIDWYTRRFCVFLRKTAEYI